MLGHMEQMEDLTSSRAAAINGSGSDTTIAIPSFSMAPSASSHSPKTHTIAEDDEEDEEEEDDEEAEEEEEEEEERRGLGGGGMEMDMETAGSARYMNTQNMLARRRLSSFRYEELEARRLQAVVLEAQQQQQQQHPLEGEGDTFYDEEAANL
mmetsp:Transcript_25921/g.43568  ORF Transcript_25921/g.43568 Transcript_25921/m.43568 type:complete len:153 (-) Transcript_25921:785-1243(-)